VSLAPRFVHQPPSTNHQLLTPLWPERTFPSNVHGYGRVSDTDLGLLQGTLDLLILKALSWGPRHGYAVARWIADRTRDELVVEDGALYTGLHRLQKRGWVRSEWGRSENNRAAKYYELTAGGRAQLQARTSLWERYARAVTRVLQTA
jgi:PadR family transcriptional regulator, regulatory protein PadR